MKKYLKTLVSLSGAFLIATSVSAEKVELYALDGRTLFVEENQVEIYTAEGMGWFSEKPVTMYSADGRTIVVPFDSVEAHKNVGWFLKDDAGKTEENANTETLENPLKQPAEKPEKPQETVKEKVFVKYTDGTVVSVPSNHLEMYKALGWVETQEKDNEIKPEIINPKEEGVTLYLYDGTEKKVAQSDVEAYKAQGWYPSYDESVYAYAAFGNGLGVEGATTLLENKKYEQAFNMVQDALEKIENTDSEYISLLYYLRSSITDTWREAANSPLGFINYWFGKKDDKTLAVFEYRNVSNSRIQSFRINFDICDKDGNVIETNSGSYFVNNLEMTPCEKKRVAWGIETGDEAKSIKNLKVKEVVFTDGTKWNSAN